MHTISEDELKIIYDASDWCYINFSKITSIGRSDPMEDKLVIEIIKRVCEKATHNNRSFLKKELRKLAEVILPKYSESGECEYDLSNINDLRRKLFNDSNNIT